MGGPEKTMHERLLEDPLATEGPTIQKTEITEKVAMTTAARLRRVALVVVLVDNQATETVIAKDTVRQSTTIVAAEVPVAAGAVVGTVTAIVIVEMCRKAEKLSWKDYRWIWLKKTFVSSTPFSYHRSCLV